MRRAAAALALVLAVAGPAAAQPADRYVAFMAGSWHVGNADLNNVTPGITFGRRAPLAGVAALPDTEWHVEGGVFLNSYLEVAPLLLGGVSAEVAAGRIGRLRLGASVGTAYYRELSRSLKSDYGIPNANGFIPIVAATAALRKGHSDLRLSVVPPGEDTVAIFNLSLARRF
ncbi:hypothetical protein DKT77_10550 [Meridianimarinicoccus roseus]|uniref:Outer membrane protein beta-barrel domain-containing protein n=1 Tax=Meridianimarinicoccus roseus TaxID=2072018 RepID=A0A2V2LB47_9RHOB|nr:hypothetical protein [Meridianimarinicoccus roseus]PWR02618.1 hypothetical protein DKT77_10550 [Meridianimarinicoccus roseus]